MIQPEIPTLELKEPARCQEVLGMLGSMHLRCNTEAAMLIFHPKDNKVYPMCLGCGTHNRDNREGIQVAVLT